jgi:hypothetical protein
MTDNSPIELYGARTGNCLRVSIALEEAALPYVVRRVDLRRGEQRRPEHLALNSMVEPQDASKTGSTIDPAFEHCAGVNTTTIKPIKTNRDNCFLSALSGP